MMDIVMPETCWAYKYNKNNKWHLVGFLFFSYHNYARSNKHQFHWVVWYRSFDTRIKFITKIFTLCNFYMLFISGVRQVQINILSCSNWATLYLTYFWKYWVKPWTPSIGIDGIQDLPNKEQVCQSPESDDLCKSTWNRELNALW